MIRSVRHRLRPVVYQAPLRITSIKTLGAPRWSRRSPSPRPAAPAGASRFYYFLRMLPGIGALAWVKTAGTTPPPPPLRESGKGCLSFYLREAPSIPTSGKKMSYRAVCGCVGGDCDHRDFPCFPRCKLCAINGKL